MIIKKCLQKKPEDRPTIDEIIFSEDFQTKAKVNKITLPKHLNREKLL
jgi:serine/threonine protein kinase